MVFSMLNMDLKYNKNANKSWEKVFHQLHFFETNLASFQTVNTLTST